MAVNGLPPAVSDLPPALAQEVEGLPRHFSARPSRLLDQVILHVTVRGVPATFFLDVDTYPAKPPRLELGDGWDSQLANRNRQLQGLVSLERWNRTLGIGSILRELEKCFRETPPTPSRKAVRSKGPSLLQRLRNWLAPLFGKKVQQKHHSKSDEIRARYEELIQEKADRLLRYRQAVNNLAQQQANKKARLTELSQQASALEKRRAAALATSRKAVESLESRGQTTDQVRRDPGYQKGLSEFQETTQALEESRQEAHEIEEESSRLHQLIETHEKRLGTLQEGLEDLREEAAEKVAELTATQIETEIRDVLSDLSPNSFTEELAELRQQVEEIERSSHVSKELAQLEASAQGNEFLASGEAASGAETFDALLGLSEAADTNSQGLVSEIKTQNRTD